MFALFRKEITAFFSNQIAYLIIGVFLLITGLLLWVLPEYSILSSGYANLQSLFELAPYVFLFLIPAISMRAFAEEQKEGTYELLATKPLTLGQIWTAKYLAALTVVFLAILPTILYVFSVYELGMEKGNLDAGAIIGSYIGLALLAAVFTAVGIFASTLSKNQMIAFVIAAAISFVLFMGFDLISTWPVLQVLAAFLQSLGIFEHYQSMSRGVLDTRDLLYFLDLIALFALASFWRLDNTWFKSWKKNKQQWLLFGLLVLFSLFSVFGFTRFDFTKEKRYTLSEVSKQTLAQLKSPVKVTIYLKGDLPAGFKQLRSASRDLVNDLAAYSAAKVELDFVDPLAGNPTQQETLFNSLYELGMEPTNLSVKTEEGLSQKTIFPHALVEYEGRKLAVKLLQNRMGAAPEEVLNNSIQNLEYAFVSTIAKLGRGEKPRIGFTEGHAELSDLQLSDAMKSLQEGYEVGRVDLNLITQEGLNKIALLIVPKPDRAFTELEKYKIDQYVHSGGKVFWALDQVNAELDSLSGRGEQLTFAKKLNLDDMLFKYGVRINYNLIADLNCAQIPMNVGNLSGQAQIQLVPWLFYPILMPLADHPMVKNLDGIRTEFASSIDTIAVPGIKKQILLSSSPYSMIRQVPSLISLQMVEQEPDPETFRNEPQAVSILLEGIFPSVFQNRPVPEGIDQLANNLPAKPAKMLVMADGDMLKNQIAQDGSPFPLGYDRYSQQQFGNKAFLLNAVDYLCGDAELIALRNKEIKIRLLDKARIKTEKQFWQFFNIVLPLLLLAIFGFFQHWWRKRKYTI